MSGRGPKRDRNFGLEYTRQVPKFLQRLGHGSDEQKELQSKFRDQDDEPPDSADAVNQSFEKDARVRYMQEHGFEGDPDDFLKAVIENDSATAAATSAPKSSTTSGSSKKAVDAIPKAEANAEAGVEGKHVFRSRAADKRKAEKQNTTAEEEGGPKKKAKRKIQTLSFDPEDE